ncbi:MAG: class I SAM-dependent methyltransferase [Verrucomicrobia bacterium]|nr:class I SAM-dependent methyltransferase [Verrucomicrobiota bacterium]
MAILTKLAKLTTNLGALALRNPSGVRHVLGTALSASEDVLRPEGDVRSFRAASVSEIARSDADPRCVVHLFHEGQSAISPLEALALASLIQSHGYKKIFEFGTYKGVSTTQFALNAGPDGKVYTLDLPENDPRHGLTITSCHEEKLTTEKGKGSLIPHDLLGRVEFIREDSAQFDPSPLENRIDFVFVDGAHSADYVENDTKKGWRLLRNGGSIAWHDCNPRHLEVVRFLKQFERSVTLIAGTSLAFCTKRCNE